MLSFLLVACQEPELVSFAPEAHSWKEEGQLVVDGLEDVSRLFKAGNKSAARVLAERVYTDRWEPRLEQAARSLEPAAVAEREYAWSLLFVELDGKGRDLDARVHALEESARAVADAASRAFPSPDSAPPPPQAKEGSHPIVPDVPPNWERGASDPED